MAVSSTPESDAAGPADRNRFRSPSVLGDSGADGGPYRSVVWRIGRVVADSGGRPKVVLGNAKRLATLDSLKVESVTVRETGDGKQQLFVGTDDEHYGGIMRLLPDPPDNR